MSDIIVYLNGQWLPIERALIGVEDRGFMFGDGVYEVIRYYHRRPIAMGEHLQRWQHSLAALRIELPATQQPFDQLTDELLERNDMDNASVYWQVTRGVARRQHRFPLPNILPTVLAIAYQQSPFDLTATIQSLRAIRREDIRWHRCDIKSTSLVANVLDNQAAADSDCDEAILLRHGIVTEGTARSLLIVDRTGQIRTHPANGDILDSITRKIILNLCQVNGLAVVETPVSSEELNDAQEVIALGTTTEVAAVVEVDGRPVGNGQPGPITRRLFDLFRQYVINECELDRPAN